MTTFTLDEVLELIKGTPRLQALDIGLKNEEDITAQRTAILSACPRLHPDKLDANTPKTKTENIVSRIMDSIAKE